MTAPSPPQNRLRSARRDAGFRSARSAAVHFNWAISTYLAHENGQNGLTAQAAARYGAAFNVDPGWLLFAEPNAAGLTTLCSPASSRPISPPFRACPFRMFALASGLVLAVLIGLYAGLV
jgi:hypothetical protein